MVAAIVRAFRGGDAAPERATQQLAKKIRDGC